jgi:hypothetical protein
MGSIAFILQRGRMERGLSKSRQHELETSRRQKRAPVSDDVIPLCHSERSRSDSDGGVGNLLFACGPTTASLNLSAPPLPPATPVATFQAERQTTKA